MKYYFLILATLVLVCVGCVQDGQRVFDRGEPIAPPASMLRQPGPMVDLPRPAIMPMPAQAQTRTFATRTTQVRFVGPQGMRIGWKIGDSYAENQLVAPGRYNFTQGATYRLKLTNIPDREGVVLYPTVQIYPAHPTTDAYLSHNSVPVELTDEDLDQVESNNFVTKVIYLPDPRFQVPAIAGVETLVSTRLDPGVDPVAEADRRGTIMVILRMGNMDLEMPDQRPAAGNSGAGLAPGTVNPVAYTPQVDGDTGQHVPPVPISGSGLGLPSIPNPMMVGGSGAPGRPAYNPIAGVGGIPSWGMPMTATPIGLPGPPYLPLGGPAGLKSHTIRNRTRMELPKPVDHMLIDVKHEPGYRLPEPAKHIEYSERHPVYSPGELSTPAWARPGGGSP